MQSVGRDYVRYINSHYRRTGTLWEERHKASLIDSEQYLLLCMRYIELNPVRALMVKHPGEYHWSSFQYHGDGKTIKGLTPHPLYLNLGTEAETRREAYKALFSNDITNEDMWELRQCLKHNYPLGGERFRAEIERMLGVRLGQQRLGRVIKEYELCSVFPR